MHISYVKKQRQQKQSELHLGCISTRERISVKSTTQPLQDTGDLNVRDLGLASFTENITQHKIHQNIDPTAW